jgi:hypothetical protein
MCPGSASLIDCQLVLHRSREALGKKQKVDEYQGVANLARGLLW